MREPAKETLLPGIWETLDLDRAPRPCVMGLVGSGGKTSLMGALAREAIDRGKKVAVLTTTHIWEPYGYPKDAITVYGSPTPEGKLVFPGEEVWEKAKARADLILVEADGSKGFPVKYPAAYEPVIKKEMHKLLCVAGLSGLGHPATQVCHRVELAAEQGLLQIGDCITKELLLKLLQEGYQKPFQKQYPRMERYFFLNQAEGETEKKAGAWILEQLQEAGMVLSLKGQENILYRKETTVAMIYLAAGLSRRYPGNKLLDMVWGKPLFAHGLEGLACLRERMEQRYDGRLHLPLIVVSRYREIQKAAETWNARYVENLQSEAGITTSIHKGLEACPRADGYLFAVADQPGLGVESLEKMLEAFLEGDKPILRIHDGVRPGNPVLFDKGYREELLALTGDRGGAVLCKKYPDQVTEILVDPIERKDIDQETEKFQILQMISPDKDEISRSEHTNRKL